MNIYIHVEIALRELDNKLLLAVLGASRGHQILVSNLNSIIEGVRTGVLKPGIFHTKSLTPTSKKIARHQSLLDRGFQVTSIDEEGGMIDHGYDTFARVRYSQETLGQASAVFGWGPEDTDTLKRVYSRFASRIYQTGPPRADLWRPRFSQFWVPPQSMPAKPYLLVSSNMGASNNIRPFHERIRSDRQAGYYQRDPKMFSRAFGVVAENYRMTLAFIEAIRYLASLNNDYDIVLRPHPVEDIEAWKVYLEDIPNVHVIREGPITAWVNNAFAVMHNGCTTAFEATISGKPVITYLPFDQEHEREIPNELGERVESLEALAEVTSQLFRASQARTSWQEEQQGLPESLMKKVYLDYTELSAEKMVKVWETLDNGKCSYPINWTKFQAPGMAKKLRRLAGSIVNKTFPRKFRLTKENYKFPPLDGADIRERVSRLQQVLGVSEPLECKLLSEHAVLIRKKP
jgi:surface carbohydrate biosynthesis protein